MKKLIVAGFLVAGALIAVKPILAEGPLPGGRPPCSVLHETDTGVDGPFCTHPVPGT